MNGQENPESPANKAYTKLLFDMVRVYDYKIEVGCVLIVVWEDKKHLEDWMAVKPGLKSVRCMKAPLRFFRMIPRHDENDVSALVIGLGTKEDFSDTTMVHYAVVREIN